MKALMTLALSAALTVSVIAPKLAMADDSKPQATETLKDVMDQMGDSMKVLVDALVKNKPIPDQTLKAASAGLPGLVVKASKLIPKKANDAQGNQVPINDVEIQAYKDMMTKLIAAFTELDTAVKAGNKPEAKTVLLTKVAPLQKEGHMGFKPQDN